jgi:hypothetical protein
MAEYVSARDDLSSAIANQHYALTFGTASIVAVLVAGFLRWEHPADPLIFFAVAPVSAWVLAVWLAEVVRMLRPVQFCREQAALINAMFEDIDPDNPPLRWEAWRDAEENTITWTYVSIVAVLSGGYLGRGGPRARRRQLVPLGLGARCLFLRRHVVPDPPVRRRSFRRMEQRRVQGRGPSRGRQMGEAVRGLSSRGRR